MLAITWNWKLLLQTFLGITGFLATAFLTVHTVPGMPGTPIHPACRVHNSFHKAFDASNHLEFKVTFANVFGNCRFFGYCLSNCSQCTRHAGYTIHFTKLLMLAITWTSKLLLQTFLGITGFLATAFLTVHNVPGMQGVPNTPGMPGTQFISQSFPCQQSPGIQSYFCKRFWELQVFWLLPF